MNCSEKFYNCPAMYVGGALWCLYLLSGGGGEWWGGGEFWSGVTGTYFPQLVILVVKRNASKAFMSYISSV